MKGLILIYFVTAAGSIAALRYPLVGLYIYVGYAVMRPQWIFGWAGNLSGISFYVGLALLIGWLLQGFGSWRFGRAWGAIGALFLYVLCYAIASLQAFDPSRSYIFFIELLKVVLPLLAGVTLMREEKHWRGLLWAIVLCQGYVGFELNLDYLVRSHNTANVGFGGMDNNFLALELVTVLGPAVALAIASRTWWERGLASLAAVLILHATLLTFSRGGMLGLLAVAGVAFVMMPKRPRNMGALLATVLLAVWLTGPQLAARYRSTFSPATERDGSAQSRIELWRDTLVVIGQYPMFGVGPGNWRLIVSSLGWPEGKSAHSVWMETAAEVGIPGSFFLLAFFGLAVKRLWPIARGRVPDMSPYEQALASGGVLAAVGFVVSGQFVSAPTLEVPYYVTMAGIAMVKCKTKEHQALLSRSDTPTMQPVVPKPRRARLARPSLAASRQQLLPVRRRARTDLAPSARVKPN